MLHVSQLCKSFGSEAVLRGVSLRLEPGELVGLIGASGAGKTILARSMVGLEAFDSGMVEVDGYRIEHAEEADHSSWYPLRRRIGLVSQDRALPPYRSVIAQVTEGPLYVGGLDNKSALLAARRWIDRLGLETHIMKYPPELSGGQLARVCLARALALSPTYLVCDEVTANLDPAMAADAARALIEIAKAGVGVLMISHQMDFLRQYATRIDFLDRGRIEVSGEPSHVLDHVQSSSLRAFLATTSLGR